MEDWVKRHTLVEKVIALDEQHYLARFRVGDADGHWTFRYVIADFEGTAIAIADPTPLQILSSHHGNLFGVSIDDVGDATLEVLSLTNGILPGSS